MGNSFNKIESKIDTISSVESLGWKDTQVPLDTVESLGWNDSDVGLNTVESLGWQNTDAEESSDESIKEMIPDEDDNESATATSSPFISTELYNKIIGNNQLGGKKNKNIEDSSSSSSSNNSSESTTSTSELGDILSLSDYSKHSKHSKKDHSQTGSSIEAYGFSNTSSELSQNFVINSDTSVSNINKDSSSINTSDINLVSVENSDNINVVSANSVNGKRFI